MEKRKIYKILLIFFVILFVMGIYNISQAVSFGSVDEIDETRYPGFKNKLKELKNTYPNITVLYTGLDWNTVISNEHQKAHGRNLVSTSMGNEWICQECRNSGIWYDSGLYCASEDAVRYVMDARNYLNTQDIFQFQKLNKDIGTTTNEISTILQIQKANYLKNDPDAIVAFVDAARENNLNAYHLVTRVIQEQGRSGTTPLSSGLGYSGNGYEYYGCGFYNLFSIGASRKNSEPAYKIYVNALDRAAIEGWNTRAASIRGGGKFVGNNYINVGQNTLYLQKFSVYNTNNQLYWHQYMQNLFGAQNEAKILYSLYQTTGIQNNKNFEFVVPIYENMPAYDSRMPGTTYDGYMTSFPFEDGHIKNENGTMTGQLVIQEWLKDSQGSNSIQAEPTVTPKVVLKSKNGEILNCNVEYISPCLYKYSININSINPTSEYYLVVQCTNNNNISSHKVVTVEYKNQEIGKINHYYTYMTNNLFNFKYDGYMVSYPFVNNITTLTSSMEGRLVVQEWLDGVEQSNPKSNPRVFLVAEDGTKVECEVGYIEPCLYGFSTSEKYIDKTKKYTIKVEAGSNKNISSNKEVLVKYADQYLGNWGIYSLEIKNSKIEFKYNGYIISYPFNQEISLRENKIAGQLVVQEWLNGTKQMEPTTLPKLVVKDTEGREVAESTLTKVMPCLYSYELDLGTVSKGNYTLEVQGTNPNNTSTHQKIEIQYNDREIGLIGTDIIKIVKGKLVREEKNNKYDGYMVSYPFNQEISLRENKITGQLVVQEWLNGTKQMEPTTLPKLVVKDTEGREVAESTLTKVMPCLYSYELDLGTVSKGNYTLEVQGTNPNNTSTHQKIEIQYNDREIGLIGTDIIKIVKGKLVREEKKNKYDGYMVSYPFNQEISLRENKIAGQLVVQEWLNGTKQMEPTTLPKLVVKDTEGREVAESTLTKVMPCLYSYELDLGTVSKGNYTLEVQGTNPNNTSTHQKIEIQYNDREIGLIGTDIIKIEKGKIIIEQIVKTQSEDVNKVRDKDTENKPIEDIEIEEKHKESVKNVQEENTENAKEIEEQQEELKLKE